MARFLGYSGGDPFFVSADFGTAFLLSAGMLNLLAILDAYDIALGRKPQIDQLNPWAARLL